MKKIVLTTIVVFIASSFAFSQNRTLIKNKEKAEYIETRKIAFITTELQLSASEAQSFWPIYNEFEKTKEDILKSTKCIIQNDISQLDKLSDKEIEELADNDIFISEKMLALRKEYHQKFKEILPIKKVLKLYVAEKKFRRILLKDYKQQGCNKINQN